MYNNQSNQTNYPLNPLDVQQKMAALQANLPNSLFGAHGSVSVGRVTLSSNPAPGQRTSEFADALMDQANIINDRLALLRHRLFGDDEGKEPAQAPSAMSIEGKVQTTHASLNAAIQQLEAIQNRL